MGEREGGMGETEERRATFKARVCNLWPAGQVQHLMFLFSPGAKIDFYIFSWLSPLK